ncbi:helix-turn-helix domain-containing protein [Alphaproteobacteria bacterium]|jgi:hypothetical protein|nr:helix-turn-helix domain-containing protein [Alphaproteobacteria bacterium]
MKEIHFYSENKTNNIINEMFKGFEIHIISLEKIKKKNFINQNILLIVSTEFLKDLNRSFFFNNKVVVFCKTNESFDNKIFFDTKFFNSHININKFIDEITAFFVGNSLNYGDVKIVGEKIINNITKKEIFLTALEKDILMPLIDRELIEKNFLLEDVLKIKKDTETKTIESHLTRIRNKLSKIDSKLKIISKGGVVFLTS